MSRTPASRLHARCYMRSRRRRMKTCTPRCPISAARRLQRLQARAPYSVRVLHHLLQQRAPQQIAMGQVARGLGVSVRSLHRRLTEEGRPVRFTDSEAAALRAKRLLDEGRTIHETAHAMGFSKVSSFHRVFGADRITPGAFQRRASDPDLRGA